MAGTPTPQRPIPAIAMDQSPRSSSNDVPSSVQRHNGFERPFSRDQVISWIGHSLSALCFFIGAAGIYLCTGEGGAEEEHTMNSMVLVTAWRSCETMDPAAPVEDSLPNGWCGVRLSGPRWEKTRYCALCRKPVPGLDHHCTWLQTCIGKNNYAQFFTVACTGTVQFVLQVAYAALSLLWLHSHPLDDAGGFRYVVEGCLIVCLVISVPCMFMYFVLVGFHLWLMILGYGTYEWMLRRRKEQRAKLEAKKKKKTGDNDEVGDVNLEERDRELTVL
ncbi:Zinc finger, DHHC-type, palmitoyltransferase [Phytophthora cactorum]|nr:Zinc finger, DHHC-type, palmitoyltransferase [Phytophthora cactorum]